MVRFNSDRKNLLHRIFITEEGKGRIVQLSCLDLDITNYVINVHFDVSDIAEDRIINQFEEAPTMQIFFPKELEFVLNKARFGVVGMHTRLRNSLELTVKVVIWPS